MLAIYLAVGALAAACNGDAAANCTPDKCESVGDTQICTSCVAGNVPIDGICKAKTDNAISTAGCKQAEGAAIGDTDTTCGQCGAGYFLHKGGCYKKGQVPGSTICSDAVSSGTNGVCDKCKADNGFFANLGPAATKQSCIACNEMANIDGVTGVAGCTACNPPSAAGDSNTPKAATCTACDGGKIVKTDNSVTSCVTEAQCTGAEGFFVKTNGSTETCEACGDENCATCAAESTGKCSKCKTTGDKTYLKESAGTGTCVAADECGDGTYADVLSKECKACHGDCAARTGTLETDCTKCKTGNSKDYLKVLDAEDGSGQCVATEEECKSEATYFLVTDTNANTKTCYPCEASGRGGVINCLTCTASGTAATATCTACRDGYTLDNQANTCASTGANKSSLSTGAIAGISVAVIVIVGGLVGFLCWCLCATRRNDTRWAADNRT
ncbi:Variant-specific surface protein [Giardia duodenalis]|uniref:Variant-specific surface protein n=1 Tax=Giardia intestinalis TaxID=5741 RepID=V6TNW1_GIAIN|nr:Variant-specific surface protein [Giardia intestinalis]